MVVFAQRLVRTSMAYSLDNGWDMPAKALRRGKGYCWQQARVLQRILRAFGIDCFMVCAMRTQIPRHRRADVTVPAHVSAHIWCRVTLDGETRDVDTVDPHGRFKRLSRIVRWNWLMSLIYYPVSAIISQRHRHEW